MSERTKCKAHSAQSARQYKQYGECVGADSYWQGQPIAGSAHV